MGPGYGMLADEHRIEANGAPSCRSSRCPWLAAGFLIKHARVAAAAWSMFRIYRRVAANARIPYTDQAMTPVTEEETQSLELFTHNKSARAAVDHARKLKRLTRSAAPRSPRRGFPNSPSAFAACRLTLSNGGQAAGHGRRVAGFDDRRGAEIDIAELGEVGDERDQGRRQKADDHDLKMGPAVGAVHRMIHDVLPSFPL